MAIECYKGECPYHEKDEPVCHQESCQECPHCRLLNFVPDIALYNAIHYGSSNSTVHCRHCNGMVRLRLNRRVIVTFTDVQQSDEQLDSWGR
jgi:hypothetical protein